VHRALTSESEGYFQDFEGTGADLAATVRSGFFYTGQRVARTGKARGTSTAGVAPERFVFSIQNHDQVGNRALGDRLGHVVQGAAYRAASALLLCCPQTPLLFMGQEWDASTPFQYFTDHHAELGRAVSAGRREEFRAFASFAGQDVPDPQARATFERSRLRWDERFEVGHAQVLALYRELLTLRRSHPALRARAPGSFDARAVGPHAVALERTDAPGDSVVLVANLAGKLACTLPGGPFELLLSTEEARFGGAGLLPDARELARGALTLAGPCAVLLRACSPAQSA
jgi:maltooligosyltrehalose trehalohydrolase